MRSYILILLALGPVACGRLQGDQGNQSEPIRPSYELSPEEIHRARMLAERGLHIPEHIHSPLERVVFIKIDLLPGSRADTDQRLVMVHHYRYRNDEVIFTMVDLNRLEVLSVESARHYPAGLAREELDRADRLARKDPRLVPVFAKPGRTLIVEGRPLQFSRPHELLFGHRVVHLLLRHGPNYLSRPHILVDLTRETVLVDDL